MVCETTLKSSWVAITLYLAVQISWDSYGSKGKRKGVSEIYESKRSATRTGKFPVLTVAKDALNIISLYNLCPLLWLLLIPNTFKTCQLQIYEGHDVVSSSFPKTAMADRSIRESEARSKGTS